MWVDLTPKCVEYVARERASGDPGCYLLGVGAVPAVLETGAATPGHAIQDGDLVELAGLAPAGDADDPFAGPSTAPSPRRARASRSSVSSNRPTERPGSRAARSVRRCPNVGRSPRTAASTNSWIVDALVAASASSTPMLRAFASSSDATKT